MLECLPSLYKSLAHSPALDLVVHACNLSTQEIEARSEVQGYSQLCSEFMASLGYRRLSQVFLSHRTVGRILKSTFPLNQLRPQC